jgi:alpha-glucosidase
MNLMPVRKLYVVGLLAGAFALAGCATKPGAVTEADLVDWSGLGLFVIFDSPVQCVCDAPEHIRGQIGAEFLKKVPTVWEESRVRSAQVGDYLVMARRAADGSWFHGGLTDGTARELELNFSFLDRGKWKMGWWRDDRQTDLVAETVRPEFLDGTARPRLKVRLSPAGGFAGRLTQGRK